VYIAEKRPVSMRRPFEDASRRISAASGDCLKSSSKANRLTAKSMVGETKSSPLPEERKRNEGSVAVCCSVSQYVVCGTHDQQVRCSVLLCVAVCCIVLQHVAACPVCCLRHARPMHVLQRIAICYSVSQYVI